MVSNYRCYNNYVIKSTKGENITYHNVAPMSASHMDGILYWITKRQPNIVQLLTSVISAHHPYGKHWTSGFFFIYQWKLALYIIYFLTIYIFLFDSLCDFHWSVQRTYPVAAKSLASMAKPEWLLRSWSMHIIFILGASFCDNHLFKSLSPSWYINQYHFEPRCP